MTYSDLKSLNNIARSLKLPTYRITTRVLSSTRTCILKGNGRQVEISVDNVIRGIKTQKFSISNISVLRNWRFNDKKKKSESPPLKYLTGSQLRHYVQSTLSRYHIVNERDFVDVVYRYVTSDAGCPLIYGVAGLRAVGKTIGLLQVISRLDSYNDTAFITIGKSMSYIDLHEFIRSHCKNKKYIFIDEFTMLLDVVSDSALLFDEFMMDGKKIVVSGTDSLALWATRGSSLFHRIVIKDVTFVSYEESVRTMGIKSYKGYLQYGGLYRIAAITSVEELQTYINTSVVSNILRTIQKNNDIILSGLQLLDVERLKTIIYMIITAIVYKVTYGKHISLKYIINQYKTNTDLNYILTAISRDLGVIFDTSFSESEILNVLNVLIEINVVIPIRNIYDRSDVAYYLTNQSIFYQVSSLISHYMEKILKLQPQYISVTDKKLGLAFESSVINHAYVYAKTRGYEVYYYRDGKNREIDMIICNENQDCDIDDADYLYYEIKFTNDIESALSRANWLTAIDFPIKARIVGRALIYSGNTEETRVKDNIPISCIPAESFVTNVERYLKVIESIGTSEI